MNKEVGFYHGGLSDSYEEQANEQGYTFGDLADWVQKIGFGLVCAHLHGCITEKEYDRILQRFQTKILVKNLKPLNADKRGEENG